MESTSGEQRHSTPETQDIIPTWLELIQGLWARIVDLGAQQRSATKQMMNSLARDDFDGGKHWETEVSRLKEKIDKLNKIYSETKTQAEQELSSLEEQEGISSKPLAQSTPLPPHTPMRTPTNERSSRVNTRASVESPIAARGMPEQSPEPLDKWQTTLRDNGTDREATRVPTGLPKFRGEEKGMKDPAEFLEAFKRRCVAHGIAKHRYAKILPLCMDSIDGKWLDKWQPQGNGGDVWEQLEHDFLQHFQHPNINAHLQSKIRRLKMGAEGLQRYADQFIELASRLRWGLDEENTIYQFKAGLLPWLAEQLSAAEANFNLMRKVSGLDEASVSVDLLMKMGLSIEANRDLQSKTSQNSGKIASRENNSKGSYGTNGKGPYPPCDHCGKRSHPAKDCWNKRADDSKGSTAPRNDSAMLKNNKPITHKHSRARMLGNHRTGLRREPIFPKSNAFDAEN